jgi:hypothetical protein
LCVLWSWVVGQVKALEAASKVKPPAKVHITQAAQVSPITSHSLPRLKAW